MTRYEYRVVPAPSRGVKVKGARTTEARFAHALMDVMNEMGREGWEYQRTDTLPCEERVGLTGRATRFQNMLVFRRIISEAEDAGVEAPPRRLPAPEAQPDPQRDESGAAATANVPERTQSIAARLSETLTARPAEGPSPSLRPAPEPGTAPPVGAANGKGLPHPGNGGVAGD